MMTQHPLTRRSLFGLALGALTLTVAGRSRATIAVTRVETGRIDGVRRSVSREYAAGDETTGGTWRLVLATAEFDDPVATETGMVTVADRLLRADPMLDGLVAIEDREAFGPLEGPENARWLWAGSTFAGDEPVFAVVLISARDERGVLTYLQAPDPMTSDDDAIALAAELTSDVLARPLGEELPDCGRVPDDGTRADELWNVLPTARQLPRVPGDPRNQRWHMVRERSRPAFFEGGSDDARFSNAQALPPLSCLPPSE